MKVGVFSGFAFRPHVEHLAYLATILRDAGHDVAGFDCVSAVETCYPRNLRGQSRLKECSKCLLGGIRSYGIPASGTVRRKYEMPIEDERMHRLTLSSVATVLRTEPPEDLVAPEFKDLQEELYSSVRATYGSAMRWIEKEGIEGVILFNGRMDLTAAVTAACEDSGIPYVTVERTWFGHGLHLVPNGNCLEIWPISELCKEFTDAPLLEDQAALAGRLAADRYLRTNKFEWRLYNPNEQRASWPGTSTGQRILVLPSSRNEFEGHPAYATGWREYTDAMDEVITRLGVDSDNVVVRCHPNWGERIGKSTGEKSEQHYARWARDRGYHVVLPNDPLSTYDLIAEADVIMANGGSAGVEAAIRGKQVVSVGHCTYEAAGFAIQVHSPNDLHKLDGEWQLARGDIVRRVLRYIYVHARRFPQFVDYVRARTTSEYEYFQGGDAERLIRILETGKLSADDLRVATDASAEDVVVQRVLDGNWRSLAEAFDWTVSGEELAVRRRTGLQWLDKVRDLLPRGDR